MQRNRIAGALVALALATGAAACGSSDSGTGGNGSSGDANGKFLGEKPGAGQKGGTLTVLAAGDVDYVDPGQVYYAFGYMVHYAVNRTLYSYGPGDNEKPRADLAVGARRCRPTRRRSRSSSGPASATRRR